MSAPEKQCIELFLQRLKMGQTPSSVGAKKQVSTWNGSSPLRDFIKQSRQKQQTY